MPQEEVKNEQAERGYFMTFRSGMSPFNFKGFKHKGDLKSARNRAFKHGEIMGYKNIWVFPQFVDLETEEAVRNAQNSGEVKMYQPMMKP